MSNSKNLEIMFKLDPQAAFELNPEWVFKYNLDWVVLNQYKWIMKHKGARFINDYYNKMAIRELQKDIDREIMNSIKFMMNKNEF